MNPNGRDVFARAKDLSAGGRLPSAQGLPGSVRGGAGEGPRQVVLSTGQQHSIFIETTRVLTINVAGEHGQHRRWGSEEEQHVQPDAKQGISGQG